MTKVTLGELAEEYSVCTWKRMCVFQRLYRNVLCCNKLKPFLFIYCSASRPVWIDTLSLKGYGLYFVFKLLLALFSATGVHAHTYSICVSFMLDCNIIFVQNNTISCVTHVTCCPSRFQAGFAFSVGGTVAVFLLVYSKCVPKGKCYCSVVFSFIAQEI